MGIPIIHTSFIFLILLLLNIFKSWEDQINRMNLWCTRLYWYTWISPFFLYMRIGYVYLCSYNVRYGNQHWLDPSCTTCKVYCQGCDAYLGFHFVRLIIIQSLFLDFFFFFPIHLYLLSEGKAWPWTHVFIRSMFISQRSMETAPTDMPREYCLLILE